MKIDTRTVIGILVIIFVLALGYSTASNYLVKYRTVTEASSLNTTEMIWVNGSILKDSFISKNTGEYNFVLTDGVSTMEVKYTGELPSSLGTEADIVIYGTFRDRTFNAVKMIARCPTKYQG